MGISQSKLNWAIENESKFGAILLKMKFYLTLILIFEKDLLMMRLFQNFILKLTMIQQKKSEDLSGGT
ncbi:MAG: hypothetical protein CM15mP129_00320 [Chloroflexota bacterium]|nr:MAG: hypothetical protein CM15mP129_00320 [Chloroflexota bacterium]